MGAKSVITRARASGTSVTWPMELPVTILAIAVRMLRKDERGPANGIQVGGYYLGQILGGGVVLVLFDRFGWQEEV